MSSFKDIDQLTPADIESFFEDDAKVTYDFVQAASRSRLPKAMVSRHTYVAAVSATRLVMWAKRSSIAKTLADLSCSIDLEELSIDNGWEKGNKKGCELCLPDGQRVIIDSMDPENVLVETLTENIVAAHGKPSMSLQEAPTGEEKVFSQPGVAVMDTNSLPSQIAPQTVVAGTSASTPQAPAKPAPSAEKTPVVTREVIIESLKRVNEGAISAAAIKQWAVKVRDYKILDADEAMVGYILFSLSRIDETDADAAKNAVAEFYERLTVTLV